MVIGGQNWTEAEVEKTYHLGMSLSVVRKVLSQTTSPLSFILATSSSSVSLRGIRKDNRDLPGHMT